MIWKKPAYLVLILALFVISCAWIPNLVGGKSREPVVIELGTSSSGGKEDFSVEQVPASIPDTTKVLDEDDFDDLESVSNDGETFYFSSGTGNLSNLSEGDVIISKSSDQFPEGLIRLVTGIDSEDDQIIVETEPTNLESAIESGNVEVQGTLSLDDVQSESNEASGKGGNVLLMQAQQDFEISIDQVVLYDKDGDDSTTYDQIVADGNILLEPGFDFRMTIKKHSIKELVFLTETTEQVSLEISSSVEMDNLSESQEIARYRFSPFTAWVGWVPVVITPVMSVNVGLDGSASVDIHSGFTQTAHLTTGLAYRYGNWTPVEDFTNEFDFIPPTLSAACEMKAYVEPRLDLLVYGIPGPYGKAQGYMLLEADPSSSPWWELSSGLQANVGVDFYGLSDYIDPYKETVINKKWTLAQAETAFVVVTEEPTETEISVTEEASTPEPEETIEVTEQVAETTPLSQIYDWISYGDRVSSYSEGDGEEIWTFEGREGDQITVSVWKSGGDLDTVLTLYDGEQNELIYNDDFGEGRDSKIEEYILPFSGEYLVGVSAYSGSGDFTLSLDLAEDVAPEVEEPIVLDIQYDETVDGYLSEDDFEVWRFFGEEGDVVTVTMKSIEGEDGNLDSQVFLSEGSLEDVITESDDSDLDYYYDSQIKSFSLSSSGEYFIKAEARSGEGGYILTLEVSTHESFIQTKGIFTVSILPPNPEPGEDYLILVETSPPESGIEIIIEIIGSDNYHYTGSGETDEDGRITFPTEQEEFPKIPGAEAGVVEMISVYAPELEQEETFEFIFE